MIKKSFTLFEVLVSLIILGIVLTLVFKIFNGDSNIETYYELQSMENQYNETAIVNQSEKVKFQLH